MKNSDSLFKFFFGALLTLTFAARADFVRPKEPANVPELLVASNGTKIVTAEQWERVRRPEILATFQDNVYGRRPVERPSDLRFEEYAAPEACFGGRAIRKRIRATYSGPGGTEHLTFSVWIPKSGRPVPAFVHCSPRPHETAADMNGPRPVYILPAEYIVSRGYAAIAYCNADASLDIGLNPDSPTGGVFKVFGPKCLSHRAPHDWGILSAWAWGLSRVMDWIETEPLIRADRVGVVGLSRNGKTALLAGALDTRFAMVVSCCSGCSGAKLNHIQCNESESIDAILRPALQWFCPQYARWRNREWAMPFDQHQFLSLVAPRLLYVSSATEDAWAGPRGEFASARLASPAWELYGKAGLVEHGFPRPDLPLHAGNVGYHLRTGLHDITRYDWQCYLDFADGHGWRLGK